MTRSNLRLRAQRGKPFWKRVFPLNPFPKTFKSFGKMVWKEPFFKRVPSKISARMLSVMILRFNRCCFGLLLLLCLLCLILISTPSPSMGEEGKMGQGDISPPSRPPISQFYQANEYYRKENYSEAISHYLDLVRQGYHDPSVFYNLGNAYFKKGELGEAILFYEKASMLLSRDDDIQKNLAYANSLTVDRIEVSSSGLTHFCEGIADFLTLNELTSLVTGIYLALVLLGGLILWKKEATVRKRLFHLLTLFSVLFILAGGILFYRIYEFKVAQFGVITSKAVEVKSGPEENLATLFSLHEGTTFSIHQQRGNWLQIMLKNGLIGWLQSKDIQKISF